MRVRRLLEYVEQLAGRIHLVTWIWSLRYEILLAIVAAGVAMRTLWRYLADFNPVWIVFGGILAFAALAFAFNQIHRWWTRKTGKGHGTQSPASLIDPKTVIVGNSNVVASGPSSTASQTINNYNAPAPGAYSGVLFSAMAKAPQAMIQFGPRGPTFGPNNSDYPLGDGLSGPLLPIFERIASDCRNDRWKN
jgi:hypothetical protein